MTIPVARDISIILLICPMLICALLPAGLAFGSWWVARRVRRALPPQIRRARSGVRRTRDALDGLTRVVTGPVFAAQTQSARWRAMWRAVLRPFRER